MFQAKGKIVVFNEPYISYEETVKYRGYAAIEAAKVGAVAALIRSITPFSVDSPHTGMMHYQEGVSKVIDISHVHSSKNQTCVKSAAAFLPSEDRKCFCNLTIH